VDAVDMLAAKEYKLLIVDSDVMTESFIELLNGKYEGAEFLFRHGEYASFVSKYNKVPRVRLVFEEDLPEQEILQDLKKMPEFYFPKTDANLVEENPEINQDSGKPEEVASLKDVVNIYLQ
jgi:hypothetical protein